MGGVMVVYGPPITHSLPPAVGASRTSQFMISKGPAVAQSEHLTVWNGLAQGCLRLSMENGRVLAPFLYAWVSEDECAPDL